jgi:hypothetical protein
MSQLSNLPETVVKIKMEDGCDDLFPKKAHDSDMRQKLSTTKDRSKFIKDIRLFFNSEKPRPKEPKEILEINVEGFDI